MKIVWRVLVFGALAARGAVGQMGSPVLSETTVKISDHVWAIMGFPNIAIVVGSRATLVVDTGLGPRNGATIARVAARLAPGNTKLFLTTTHFHPEHAAGEPGFPVGTILVRDAVQQAEMEKHGTEMVEMFKSRSAENEELLRGVVLRAPDVTFDQEATIDLGDVKARLMWLGEAHTKGDELTLVLPDRTLISGDVVQNKTIPNIFGDGGTPGSWLGVLDKVEALHAEHILPDHSAPGDGSLVAAERELIATIRDRARVLKGQGVPVEDAGRQISGEIKAKHPDWGNTNAGAFVKSCYAELP